MRQSLKRLPGDARCALLLYNLFFPLVLVCLLPRYLLRMFRRGKYSHKFGQRFGVYSAEVRLRLGSAEKVWIHAVSVGEVLIAQKLARELHRLREDLVVILSTTTSTGFEVANSSAPGWMEVIYNPIDFPLFVGRALEAVRPRALILVEAEVWPNLVSQAHSRGVYVSLVNARLSPRSEGRFRKARVFTGPFFRLLDSICVQEEEDVDRWQALGVARSRIHPTGSIKFDHVPDTDSREEEFRSLIGRLAVDRSRLILLAGSTHPGEETILGRVFQRLKARFPELFLVVVPRHVERTSSVEEGLRSLGLSPALRTSLEQVQDQSADCLIVNTTGELRHWYHLGSVIFIGKSLTGTGGQNPVEAIAAGKPVVFGPRMENFGAIVQLLLRNEGAVQVSSEAELEEQLGLLFANEPLRNEMAENGRTTLARHQGATTRTVELLRPVLRRPLDGQSSVNP